MTDARRLSDAATGAAGWATRERSAEIRAWYWTTFVALVLYALILGGSWAGIYWVSLRVLSLALITLALLAWLVLAVRWPRLRPSTAIWPAIALPPVTLALSALASPFQRLGLEYVAWATLLAALYLLLVRILARPYARARIGVVAAILGLTLGVTYIGSVLILWMEWWILLDGLVAPPMRPLFVGLTWGNPSAVLTIEVLLLLIAAAGLGTGSRRARVTLTVLAVMTLLVVVMSGSRAGWIAVAGASVIVGGIWVAPDIWRRVKSVRTGLTRALSDRRIVIAMVICGILAIVFIPGISARVENGGDGGRPLYYTIAMRMFADNPILGLGPGTWAARRVAYTAPGELDFIAPHAHDVYLQTAAELGIVGLAVGVIALACVAWLVIGAIRGDRPERRRWAWAAVLALVYLGLHSVLDFYANMPAVLLLVAIPVAILDATADRRLGIPARLEPFVVPIRALAFGTLIVASGMAIIVLGRSESIALAHQAAVDAANDSDWGAAFPQAARAARQDPGVAPYQQTLGMAAAGVGAWRTAAAAFETAAGIDAYLPASWLGLAVAQQRNGDPAEVVASSLRRALRLGVQQAAVAFGAGQVYDRIGMPAAADDSYVDALLRLPELAAASSWGRVGVNPERFERLVTRAIERSPASGWRLALMAGEVDRARSIAQESGQWYPSLVIDAWTGDDDAFHSVRSIADSRAFDVTSLSWAALVSAHLGDDASAGRYQRLLQLAFPDAGSTRLVGIGDRGASRDTAIGTNSVNYGNYMYRRASPVDLIVPDLPGLTLAVRPSTGPPADSASARRDDR